MKRVLIKYVSKYKIYLIISIIAMLLSIVLDMFNPYFTKIMIDKVIIENKRQLFSKVLLGLVFISVTRAIFCYINEYLFDYISSLVSIDLKSDLFIHIQSLSFKYFDEMNTGELMSRIGEDIDNIWSNVSYGIRLFLENCIYFITASVILFTINYKLAFISLLVMPFIAYFAFQLEKKIGITYGKISDQAAILNTTAQENIAGVRLVKAFARERHEILRFLEMNKMSYKLNMEQADVISRYFPIMELLSNIAIVLVVSVGGMLVMKQYLSLGSLVEFNGYLWMLIWPMRMLGWLTNVMAQSNASAKKIFNIMDLTPEIKNNDNPIKLDKVNGRVTFKDVSFKYNDEYVLKNINIDVKPGQTIAIMGTTGSGKTSLVNLIGRFYDVSEGQVLFDGVDVRDLCLSQLRENIAYVFQDTFLFSETIEENIKIGNPNASIEDIRKVCEEACADDFISQFHEGYNTVIGERGIGLSGGQKQRISIARALIKNSKVLILDDATSALDTDTEYQLLKNLYCDDKKVTIFIIAHRISAVKNADEIIFLEKGRIVERGDHETLLKQRGRYYEVYCEQFKDFKDLDRQVI
ncbi:MAG: ABC transporter ATP-binding protein/permease [Caloramator sp.]|nr:ABC transporter ATP-binding protein/permease [Caloramator sp.]